MARQGITAQPNLDISRHARERRLTSIPRFQTKTSRSGSNCSSCSSGSRGSSGSSNSVLRDKDDKVATAAFETPGKNLEIRPADSSKKDKEKKQGRDTAGEIRLATKDRELDVFKLLLPFPGESHQPGAMRWSDVVRAMESIGFRCSDINSVSFNFYPRDDCALPERHKITCHAPHDGKLEFRDARKFGRRLAKVYGLHSGMFVQA